MRALYLVLFIGIGVGLASWRAAASETAAQYYIEAVDEFGPDMISHVTGINNLGDVVGWVAPRSNASDFRAWRRLNGTTTAEILGDSRGQAVAINDDRTIASTIVLSDGRFRARRFTDADGFVDIGTLGGTQSASSAINQFGDIAGVSFLPGDVEVRGFRTAGTEIQDLGALVTHSGPGATTASGINAAGQVTGTAVVNKFSFLRHAIRFTAGIGWEDLGTLGGTDSEGAAINASGQVCGMAVTGYNPSPRRHAFRYTTGVGMQDLTPERPGAWATALNDRGDVVGALIFGTGEWTPDNRNPYHAFVYTDTEGLTDLNTRIDPLSGWVLNYAYGINNSGDIVGDGELNGQPRAFKLAKDVVPPVIVTAAPSVSVLWPPDGRAVAVTVTAAASDDHDPAPSCRVTDISTNEPSGSSQFAIIGPLSVTLEAARDGHGMGRIYSIVLTCSDRSGNATQRTIAVNVPHHIAG